MSFWKRRAEPDREDRRTEVLIDKMDTFLVELQSVADRLVAKLDKESDDRDK